MTISNNFKATYCGAEYHNIDGTGWPDAVVMENQGSVLDGTYESKRYYPERTCKMELIKNGAIYRVWRFSCCGYEYSENMTDSGATELPGTRCPKCGAEVVE